jgi:hypothetical protein
MSARDIKGISTAAFEAENHDALMAEENATHDEYLATIAEDMAIAEASVHKQRQDEATNYDSSQIIETVHHHVGRAIKTISSAILEAGPTEYISAEQLERLRRDTLAPILSEGEELPRASIPREYRKKLFNFEQSFSDSDFDDSDDSDYRPDEDDDAEFLAEIMAEEAGEEDMEEDGEDGVAGINIAE